MRWMNENSLYRMIRLLKAGDHPVPVDVEAYAIERGFALASIKPADTYHSHELNDLLEAAGLNPDDVMSTYEQPDQGASVVDAD